MRVDVGTSLCDVETLNPRFWANMPQACPYIMRDIMRDVIVLFPEKAEVLGGFFGRELLYFEAEA